MRLTHPFFLAESTHSTTEQVPRKKGMGKVSQFSSGEKEEESPIICEETSLKFLDFKNLTLRCD